MNKKTVNYITNLIGLAIISLAFYEYFETKVWSWFIGLIVVGFSFLLIDNKTLQGVLKSIISRSSKERSTLDPDREYPDDRG